MRTRSLLLGALLTIGCAVSASAQYSDTSEECRVSTDQASSTASDLANYSKRLQRCAEAEDFTDDCSSEFRRVKNAHSDYESVVSEVSVYCN